MASIRKLSNGKFRTEIRKLQSTIKSKTFSTQLQAEKWGSKLDKQIKAILKIKPNKLKNLSPNKIEQYGGMELFKKLGLEVELMTFHELVHAYMLQWTGKDKNQIYRAAYWQDIFDSKPIKSIKSKHVRKAISSFASEFKKDGAGNPTTQLRSSNTVIRYKAVLSAIFKYAIQQGDLEDNPVDGVFVKATPNKITRYLDDEERNALLIACRESSWSKLYLLVILAITTGMRKSELMYLRWSDIDFDTDLARLSDTKNGEPRVNPIPKPAMDELKNFRQVGNSYIFNSPAKPNKPFEFRRRWFDALKQAGIEEFRFHDLRHTAASYLVMGGATLHEAAEILGHKSTETTKRYAHLSTQHKSEVAGKIMGKVFKT